jgi:hypothetical protein
MTGRLGPSMIPKVLCQILLDIYIYIYIYRPKFTLRKLEQLFRWLHLTPEILILNIWTRAWFWLCRRFIPKCLEATKILRVFFLVFPHHIYTHTHTCKCCWITQALCEEDIRPWVWVWSPEDDDGLVTSFILVGLCLSVREERERERESSSFGLTFWGTFTRCYYDQGVHFVLELHATTFPPVF